jgi:hypothetical protein
VIDGQGKGGESVEEWATTTERGQHAPSEQAREGHRLRAPASGPVRRNAFVDPYVKLAVPKDLVADFLGVFARCEFAMKATAYARNDHRVAAAAWQRLANDAGSWVQAPTGSEVDHAIDALTSEPPRLQAFGGGWTAEPLPGANRVAQAVNAAVRVRNNLFHGGKHTPESAPGRDELLVRSALTVLLTVVEQRQGDLRAAYDND